MSWRRTNIVIELRSEEASIFLLAGACRFCDLSDVAG
jgi:hypothetical protein